MQPCNLSQSETDEHSHATAQPQNMPCLDTSHHRAPQSVGRLVQQSLHPLQRKPRAHGLQLPLVRRRQAWQRPGRPAGMNHRPAGRQHTMDGAALAWWARQQDCVCCSRRGWAASGLLLLVQCDAPAQQVQAALAAATSRCQRRLALRSRGLLHPVCLLQQLLLLLLLRATDLWACSVCVPCGGRLCLPSCCCSWPTQPAQHPRLAPALQEQCTINDWGLHDGSIADCQRLHLGSGCAEDGPQHSCSR